MGREGTTCGVDAGAGCRRGQYRLSTFLTAGFLAGAWFAALNPWRGVPFLLPAVVAATFAACGAGTRGVRWACLAPAVCGCLLCLLMAFASYPLIVPADSDLGLGAREMVRDWLALFELWAWASAVIGISQVVPWLVARLVLSLGLLAVTVRVSFESAEMPPEARWGLVTLAAVLLAAEGLPAFGARVMRWFPFGRCGWILLFPALVIMADWQGRIYLGLLPESARPRTGAEPLPMGESPGITDCEAASPDGKTFATWEFEGVVKLWDEDTGRLLREMDAREAVPLSLAFTPEGEALIGVGRCAGDERVYRWSVRPSPFPLLALSAVAAVSLAGVLWISRRQA